MKLKFLLVGMAILSLCVLVESTEAVDLEKCVGMWLFDDDGEKAIDSSGNGHDGTIQGNGGRVEGKFGSALNVPLNGWVKLGTADDLHLDDFDEWSIVAWFTIDAINSVHTIVTKWPEYSLTVDKPAGGTKLNIAVKRSSGWTEAWGQKPELDTWTHAAAVWNRKKGTLKLYQDGVETASGEAGGEVDLSNDPPCIGRRHEHCCPISGLVDEVAIFNKALTKDDINEIMNKGLEEASISAVFPENKLATTWGIIKYE